MKYIVNKRLIVITTFFTTVLILLGGYWIFTWDHFYVHVHGTSMEPTFHDDDWVVLKKTQEVAAGNIVIFPLPKPWRQVWHGNDNDKLIKRIALVPGDILTWDGHAWYGNGKEFSSLSRGECDVPPMKTILKAGQIFVTGDTAHGKTLDSREMFCKNLPYLIDIKIIEVMGNIIKIF